MKKVFFIFITLLVLTTLATASFMIPANDEAKDNAKAPEHSPVIDENWKLERVDFIHYAKPDFPARGPKTNSCYKLMGVKWKTLPVNYIIKPGNPQNLTQEFTTSAISTSAETWDA